MRYMPEGVAEHAYTTPQIGGIGKFIREYIRPQKKRSQRRKMEKIEKPINQRKHGEKGWLHITLSNEL